MFSGMKSIEFLANKLKYQKYSVRQFFEVDDSHQYSHTKMPIGIDEYGRTLSLDISQSLRILVCGAPGSGKSFLVRSLWNRYYMSGGLVFIPTDIAPEHFASSLPVQDHFKKHLLKNEKLQFISIKNYYPYFFTNFVLKDFKQQFCQLNIKDMNVFDFLSILNIKNLDDNKKNILEQAFAKVTSGEVKTLEELRQAVIKNSQLNSNSKNLISNSIKNLIDMGVVGEQYSNFDMTQDLLDGNVVIINMYGYNKMGEYVDYASSQLSHHIRKMLSDKMEEIIPSNKNLLTVIEESTKFCPNDAEPPSKKIILEGLEQGRKYGFGMMLVAQDTSRIPDTVLKECRYIFIPKIDITIASSILKRSGMEIAADYPINFYFMLQRLLSDMKVYKDGSRDWILVDKLKSDIVKFVPLSPISHHREEGEDVDGLIDEIEELKNNGVESDK